jgi:hypothetical protein
MDILINFESFFRSTVWVDIPWREFFPGSGPPRQFEADPPSSEPRKWGQPFFGAALAGDCRLFSFLYGPKRF